MIEKQHAVDIFSSATGAVQPSRLIQEHLSLDRQSLVICGHKLPLKSVRHIYVIGAGKASAAMAVEAEKILGNHIRKGLVTTKYGHALDTRIIKITEAAHPVPDENSILAVAHTLQLLEKATEEDLVICLISGGASALWCDVPQGIILKELQSCFDLLIRSGASIHEINTIRKHLSGVKGGQLIRHCGGARVFSLIISDVPGDDLDVIASGPTVADVSTFRDAFYILEKYNLTETMPRSILQHIEEGRKGKISETPKPLDPLFRNTVNSIIGNNRVALLAAAKKAEALGYLTQVIPNLVRGDAEEEAVNLVRLASRHRGSAPYCILQGGETTVRVTGKGKGGRNQHFVLAALREMARPEHAHLAGKMTILSGGTDGTDGPTDAAGGVVSIETMIRASEKSLSVETFIRNQDSYHFLGQTDGLLVTGPTQTNVMDIMMALVK